MAAPAARAIPGESRFYLSLDDELMRLFATGALSYVMNKALPDDEAIEAKMVTKAIERAQTTVETRNAEIRKNVLKYDEVMNEQRKVIYARRDQILEGVDLKSAAMEYLAEAVHALLETHCASAADDEWDLDGLAKELKTFWPTDDHRGAPRRVPRHRRDVRPRDGRRHGLLRAARGGARRAKVMREVERQVMLRIIDQRWREHLEEMDYLKEGINLRAMGQKDPLTEWQREGYEMFGSMMKGIAQDFVRYVMHVQVVQQQQQQQPAAAARPRRGAGTGRRPGVQNLQTTSSDTEQASGFLTAAASAVASGEAPAEVLRRRGLADGDPPDRARQANRPAAKQETVVKDEWSKTPRNAPCPCGSGKKFKMCHGARLSSADDLTRHA